jgi:arylformamidase
MALIDLTHPIDNMIPVFPGEPGPKISNIAEHKTHGYRVKWLEMGSHTGTHMDAPAHLIPDGKTLDQFSVSHFTGIATVIPIPPLTSFIEIPFLTRFQEKIRESGFVLFATGWSKFWGADKYFRDFPVLTADAARWLAGHPLKGIGMDTISADPVNSVSLQIHHIILNAGILIIENLLFPQGFHADKAVFHCFPLRIADADGSPVRAVLSVEE